MTEVTSTYLKKTYGDTAVIVLHDCLEQIPTERKRGVKKKYKVLKPLPSADEFRQMQIARFTFSIDTLVDDAFSEFETLRDELREWYDNLPESFQSGGKGNALEESADALENLERPDIPECAESITAVSLPSSKVNSRADRRDEASGQLRTAVDAINEFLDEDEELEETVAPEVLPIAAELEAAKAKEVLAHATDTETPRKKLTEDQRSKLEQLRDDLETAADEAESVEFPAMFG